MLPNDHLVNFQRKVQRTRRMLARQILLSAEGRIPKTELESIYEFAFLSIFVAFENDVTELFKTNLMMSLGSDGKKRSLFEPKNRRLAEKLLLGTNRYFQMLPVEQMEKIAKIYLKDGGPFVTLLPAQRGSITKAYAIRNHIAHRSPESRSSFQRKVLAGAILPRPSSSAGYYLANMISAHRTYFEHHVAEIGGTLRTLCQAS